MQKYQKAKLGYITANWVIFVILLLISTIFLSIQSGGDVFIFLIFSFLVLLFVEFVVIAIKLLLYSGQYGVAPEINQEEKIILAGKKKMSFLELKTVSKYEIRYYGCQINLEDKTGNKIKFFSPDAVKFESDLISFLKEIGKNIESKSQSFPNNGMIHTII